jgi:nucleotide-binding universal stress UspA family protein
MPRCWCWAPGSASLGSVLLGSVAGSVAARAACPVVVLRGPATEPAPGAQVIVGVDGAGGSESVLEFALEHASSNRLPVTALLCWKGDRLAITRQPPRPSSTDRARDWLDETMAGWAAKYPDVQVRAALVRDDAVTGLVLNSNEQSLLVV